MISPLTTWKVLSNRPLYELGTRIRVSSDTVELPSGTVVQDYLKVELRSFALVFATTVVGEVLCLRQYKHGPRRIGLTLPAGGIEQGENPLDAAKRELLEETGYSSDRWQSLGEYAVSGNQGCGVCFIFKAIECVPVANPHPDDIEEMLLELKSSKELKAALAGGEFTIASHAAAAALGLLLE